MTNPNTTLPPASPSTAAPAVPAASVVSASTSAPPVTSVAATSTSESFSVALASASTNTSMSSGVVPSAATTSAVASASSSRQVAPSNRSLEKRLGLLYDEYEANRIKLATINTEIEEVGTKTTDDLVTERDTLVAYMKKFNRRQKELAMNIINR